MAGRSGGALVAVCMVVEAGCGGGTQMHVRGATFDLSGKETDIATQYLREEPNKPSFVAERCNYWKKRVGDAQGGHTIGILNWPAEYFEHLRSWVAAMRDDACAAPGAGGVASTDSAASGAQSAVAAQVSVANDPPTITVACTRSGAPMPGAQAILVPSVALNDHPPGPFFSMTTGQDGRASISTKDAREIIFAGTAGESAGQVVPVPFKVACVQPNQGVASCAQAMCRFFEQAPARLTTLPWTDAPAMDPVMRAWQNEARAAKAAEQAAPLRANATTLVAAKNFADARAPVRQCLRLVADDSACLALQAKLDASALDTARKLMVAHRVIDAQYEVGRCLALNASDAACAKLKPTIDAAAAQIRPDHIKDVAFYEEGGGWMFYFSLVNSAQSYVPADGKVSLSIQFESSGMVTTEVLVGGPMVGVSVPTLRFFDVSAKDFGQRQVGVGGLAHNVLLWSKLLPANLVYQGFPSGRLGFHSIAENAERVYIAVRFVDGPSGQTLTARDTISPP